jgi:outer membrane immunogenic protein
MKKLLLGTAMSLAMIGGAAAADLPPAPAPAPVYVKSPPPSCMWCGFYIGVNGGGVWARDVVSPTIADGGTFPRSNILTKNGGFYGGDIGYNFQSGPVVFGIEGDLGYMAIGTSASDPLGGTEVDFLNSGLYGDVTGRFGFAFDRALIYAKGGYAFYNGQANTTTAIAGFTGASTSAFSSGWTAGGGLEFKIMPAWTIKAEYLHFDFGSKTATLTSGGGTVFGYTNALTADTVKVGVNWLFGGGGPVYSKY